MSTAKEYRFQAKECLEHAKQANEPYIRAALTELAREYNRAAHQTERRERDLKMVAHLQTRRSIDRSPPT